MNKIIPKVYQTAQLQQYEQQTFISFDNSIQFLEALRVYSSKKSGKSA